MKIARISLWFVVVFIAVCTSEAGEPSDTDLAPTANAGEKWRIAYVEGGPYQDYQATLEAFVKSLMEMGWMWSAVSAANSNACRWWC